MKFKRYLIGVVEEGKRVRWCKGQEFTNACVVTFAYTIFFALS